MNGSSPKKPTRKTVKQAQDDLVMATNNSSIVSKRSVEKLYYPHEPHFFRYFVKKFQRRSPLINRGYHLRLHLIDVLVRNFLKKESARNKVIVNLGCGSDVIPWQCMARYPDDCGNVKFVDIDFPDLLQRKRQLISETPELKSAFRGWQANDNGPLLVQSDQYYQIGCDLCRTDLLDETLATIASPDESTFLFIAEVSITYMETADADKVLTWASSLAKRNSEAEFCLLEQILPDGPEHPFARTMIRHFEKLKSPLKSIHKYPTAASQAARFKSCGWSAARVWTLWSAWADDFFLSASDRRKLDAIEPFDEWEEFALFASHYVVVRASTNPEGCQDSIHESGRKDSSPNSIATTFSYAEMPRNKAMRRFASPMVIKNNFGQPYPANLMGLGSNTRLRSYDFFSTSGQRDLSLTAGGPTSRMCHSLTDLGDHGYLLAGGRSSPGNAFQDSWIFRKGLNRWERLDDLPVSVYRHTVVRLGESSFALLAGGKTGASSFLEQYLVYTPSKGWIDCKVSGQIPPSVSGATLLVTGDDFWPGSLPNAHGILAGGICHDGVISDSIWRWHLDLSVVDKPTITFSDFRGRSGADSSWTSRYGASIVKTDHNIIVFGGIVRDKILPQEQSIVSVCPQTLSIKGYLVEANIEFRDRQPLLVGSSVAILPLPDKRISLAIMGGGATCFSMGTFWNRWACSFTLEQDPLTKAAGPSWNFSRTQEIIDQPDNPIGAAEATTEEVHTVNVPRVEVETAEDFEKIIEASKPVIIQNLDIGSCTSQWTPEYLTDKIGHDRQVVVHESATAALDFNAKNFRYATRPFGAFMADIAAGQPHYLRALSRDQPADAPADLRADFPLLAADFALPAPLSSPAAASLQNVHSTVLRISGPARMWLHFDVMANLYAQVRGAKRLTLFPPTDVSRLGFAPSASSSGLDVTSASCAPPPPGTRPHAADLAPGDVLYLPPLWPHASGTPRGAATSVAVNVFFRNLGPAAYATGRDVYGNRDLAAYDRGRRDLARLAGAFAHLPPDARAFYLRRLADELLLKARE